MPVLRRQLVAMLAALVAWQAMAAGARGDIRVPDTLAEARAAFSRAGAELNRLWQRCVAPESATVQSIAMLREAQRVWPDDRDVNARAFQLANSDRRPLDDAYYLAAREFNTRARIAELKALFGCE